jgi:transcription antitermination factor NusG
MTKLKNLTNSPFDLPGGHILPANGEWEGELPEAYLLALKASPAVKVDEDPLEPFRAEYERLTGKRADKRWSETRLFEEIEKADDSSAI